MRPNTSAASPRSRSVSRLTSASSKALRSKRAWNVPPESASLRSRSRQADGRRRLEALVGVVDVGLLVGEIGCCWVMANGPNVEPRRLDRRGSGATCARWTHAAPQRGRVTPSARDGIERGDDVCRGTGRVAFLAGGDGAAAPPHARVVHAPGRSQPARVPGDPGRGLDPRRHQAARDWRRRSRCSRCAATASTPRCCTATSSCRPTRSGSASTSRPAPGPSPPPRCAAAADLARLRPLDPDDIALRRRHRRAGAEELRPTCPCSAFAGAPFTVASYLIEGRPSRDYRHTKALMHTDEALWHERARRLGDIADRVPRRPARRRRQAPSSCSTRGPARSSRVDYERYVLPHSRRVFAELARPPPGRARRSTSASAATTCSSRWRRPARA